MSELFTQNLFTQNNGGGGGTGGAVDSVNGKTGTVVLTGNDLSVSSTNATKVATAVTENGNAIVGLSAELTNLSQVVEGKQDKLTAGEGINIEGNTISSTSQIPANLYTEDNLIAGNNVTITEVLPEGGIDNHALACWHLDSNRTNAATNDSAWGTFGNVNSTGSGFDTNTYKFGTASYRGGALSSNPSLGYVEKSDSFTLDFWAQKYSDSTNFAQFGFVSSSYNELGFALSSTDGVLLNGLKLSSTQSGVSLSSFNIDFSDNEFHHIAYIYDKDTKKVYFYCDGKFITSADTVNNLTYHLLLNTQFNTNYFRLDEIRFSDIARPLNPDGTFPVPTKPYSLAIPTGKKQINAIIPAVDLSGYIPDTQKGVANGIASLDANTKVPSEQIPVATASTLGGVKPDGTSIAINEAGTISTVNTVHSTAITTIVKLTQAEYDALTTKDENTLYYIVEG